MRSVPLTAFLVTLLATTAPVLAQAPQAPAATMPNHAPLGKQTAEVDEAELQQFASAFGEIRQLRRKWLPQVEEATSPGEAQQMEEAAYAEMVDAVETQGLSVRRYNQIAALAHSDPELQDRIARRLQR